MFLPLPSGEKTRKACRPTNKHPTKEGEGRVEGSCPKTSAADNIISRFLSLTSHPARTLMIMLVSGLSSRRAGRGRKDQSSGRQREKPWRISHSQHEASMTNRRGERRVKKQDGYTQTVTTYLPGSMRVRTTPRSWSRITGRCIISPSSFTASSNLHRTTSE